MIAYAPAPYCHSDRFLIAPDDTPEIARLSGRYPADRDGRHGSGPSAASDPSRGLDPDELRQVHFTYARPQLAPRP